jgi:hypothetical protein
VKAVPWAYREGRRKNEEWRVRNKARRFALTPALSPREREIRRAPPEVSGAFLDTIAPGSFASNPLPAPTTSALPKRVEGISLSWGCGRSLGARKHPSRPG